MHQYATPLNTLLHSSSLEWWWMARAFLFQSWTILTLPLDLPASHRSPRVVFCVFFYSAQNRFVKRMPIFPTNSSYMSLCFAIPTVQVFESAVLWHVVITTSKTRLNSFFSFPRRQWWFHIVYLALGGRIPEIVGCRSVISIANAISKADIHVRFLSARSFFWVDLFLKPQKNRPRRASSRNVPKAQCSEHFFKASL